MAVEITIPRLGWNMDEGVFVEWLKADGDFVRAGEMLFSLQGDKAVSEVECLDAGILRFAPDAPTPGDTVPVGQVIGYLLSAGEAVPNPSIETPSPAPDSSVAPAPAPAANVEAHPSPSPKTRISPRARKVAQALGIEVSGLVGTGVSGRIREADVRAAVGTPPPSTEGRRVPLTPLRRAIATQMIAARDQTVPVTLTTRVDATNLVNLREQFKAAAPSGETEVVPSYTDFIVKLAALALAAHPEVNARWDGDAITLLPAAHVSIAVDTDAGLVAPVLRDVGSLGLRALAAQSRALITRARAQRLTPEELRGGTFTVTNLGAYGIDAFTPIINVPECAILGVGTIRREPVAIGDHFQARQLLTLSLTFDHRVLDGAPAARFLAELREYLENPAPRLLG